MGIIVHIKRLFHFLISNFAYWYYGCPSRRLIVIGVTGTKGKSTTCKFIHSVLQAGGFKTCLMSTVEYCIGDEEIANKNKMTMLGRGQIHKFLKQAVLQDCQYAVIETSSEGILQYRHLGLNYDIAVFTNLGTEHSERHGGFENLKKAKGELFASLNKENKVINGKKIKTVIIANGDDDNVDYFLNFKADEKMAYGFEPRIMNYELGIMGVNVNSKGSGVEFLINNSKFIIHVSGRFNVYNALVAIAVGQSQNISEEKIKRGLADVKIVPGRMEFITEGQNFDFIVDYAHELLSYTALFTELREILNKTNREHNKTIAIIGSDGGGRDISKRSKMGKIAGELADVVVVTDVNCFDENPLQIAEMLAVGARESGKKDGVNLFIEIDRKKAIELSCQLAKPGDMVVLTAKGTEPCIVVAGGKKLPWDDREVARVILHKCLITNI